MDMNLMLGILASVYFVSLTLICLYSKKINVKVFNIVFIVLDVIFYFIWNVGMYERGWLEDGFETLANISPFTFTLIPFTLLMKDKVKEYAFAAIAFLWAPSVTVRDFRDCSKAAEWKITSLCAPLRVPRKNILFPIARSSGAPEKTRY